jgi:hypothetical protein
MNTAIAGLPVKQVSGGRQLAGRDTVNQAEAEFRHIESTLDALVRDAEQYLRAEDVQVEDTSARTYLYQKPHLLWSYSFLKEWRVDAEKSPNSHQHHLR